MYLHAIHGLGQPKKEPSRQELEEELLLCRRDALMASRSTDQDLARTERAWEEAMQELKECRNRLEAAQAALKAARRKGRRKARPKKP